MIVESSRIFFILVWAAASVKSPVSVVELLTVTVPAVLVARSVS